MFVGRLQSGFSAHQRIEISLMYRGIREPPCIISCGRACQESLYTQEPLLTGERFFAKQ